MRIHPNTLENPVVRLEPLTHSHHVHLRPVMDEPELWAETVVRGDGEHFEAWFAQSLAAQSRPDQITYVLFDARTGTCAGVTALLAMDPLSQRLEIGGTRLGRGARGSKINPASKHLLLTLAFNAGARRVELRTLAGNARSERAIQKLGAVREGVRRHYLQTWKGQWRDSIIFSILDREWPTVKARLEARI